MGLLLNGPPAKKFASRSPSTAKSFPTPPYKTKVRYSPTPQTIKLTTMPRPMRALTNDHKDCRLIKLDPADPTSPYAVMQEGYDSNDPRYRMRMFYLQRDAQWICGIGRRTRPGAGGGGVRFETS